MKSRKRCHWPDSARLATWSASCECSCSAWARRSLSVRVFFFAVIGFLRLVLVNLTHTNIQRSTDTVNRVGKKFRVLAASVWARADASSPIVVPPAGCSVERRDSRRDADQLARVLEDGLEEVEQECWCHTLWTCGERLAASRSRAPAPLRRARAGVWNLRPSLLRDAARHPCRCGVVVSYPFGYFIYLTLTNIVTLRGDVNRVG